MTQTSAPLYRSRKNRWLAGICGGLSEFFGINAFLIRLLFVIFSSVGGVIYILMWIFVRSNPNQKYSKTSNLVKLVLLFIAVYLVVSLILVLSSGSPN